MEFLVTDSLAKIKEKSIFALIIDQWNDWFTFRTMYTLIYIDKDGFQRIGSVKIGQKGLDNGRPVLDGRFERLDDNYFSLGQSAEYYENLNKLSGDIRSVVLEALNDVAYKNELYNRFKDEEVMKESLTRSVPLTSISGHYHRLALGNASLSKYNFKYTLKSKYDWEDDVTLNFIVKPNSKPPSNVHVLIGRNGVGKTWMLTNMIYSILDNDGAFLEDDEVEKKRQVNEIFASVVFVSFSAFDYEMPCSKEKIIDYNYIGLKKRNDCGEIINKKVDELTNEFVDSLVVCVVKGKMHLWENVVGVLDSDPIFKENKISSLLYHNINNWQEKDMEDLINNARNVFSTLSSGHKIVLLTLSSLVAIVEERTLVLLDEPEVHLHPPLLAAFTRALSELLINRNGVAIVATHSPVVLQEVPKECVWKLRRYGTNLKAERLVIESFGENLGVLTSEVFKHEVTESGVHKILKECVDKHDNFEEIMELFDEKLGMEAQAILRALISCKIN